MSKRVSITLLLLAVFVSIAAAQDDERVVQFLKRNPTADANGDGKLSAEEFRAFRAKQRINRQAGGEQVGLKSTHANVSYGPHPRNVLDLWRAPSDKPTPLVICIHGGGFQGGDKSSFASARAIQQFHDAGISVAAINYRLTEGGKHPFPAPMEDGARAVQFLRYHAKDYNLDKTRFGATGGSAGGCMLMWLGFHPDMAQPDSADPVLRESSRLQALAPSAGQPSLHLPTLYEWFEVETLTEHPAFRPLFGLSADEKFAGNQVLDEAMRAASPITYLTADDPPIYMTYGEPQPVDETSNPSLWVHHGTLGVKLKEQMDALKIECRLRLGRDTGGSPYGNSTEFLIDKLSGSR